MYCQGCLDSYGHEKCQRIAEGKEKDK